MQRIRTMETEGEAEAGNNVVARSTDTEVDQSSTPTKPVRGTDTLTVNGDSLPPTTPTTPGTGGDESWEIKYGKLREVALKLKKSVLDKSQEIERLRTENSKISGKSQNVSTIQQQFDKALDELEKYKSLEASLQKDLQTSIKDNLSLKESNFEFQAQVKELADSSKILKEKLESNQASEGEVKQLKLRVDELETELRIIKETQVDVKQEKRQRTMLSLEITDYEKKLADSNEKLLEYERQLQLRQQLLEEKDKLMASCEVKLGEAETTIGDLGCKVEQLQVEITSKSEKISFLQSELSKLNERFSEKKSEFGKLSREYETAKLNFSSESSILVERCEKLTQLVSQLEYKISVLEEHKRSRESHISNLKLELLQLESEFGNYKLKAQSMLNIQKPTGTQSAGESDELENLQRIVQDFHSEIAVLKSDANTLKLENETLCLERAELGLKVTQLKTATIEKEMIHDSEIQKLKEFNKQKESEFQAALEHSKTENAAIIASYKVQFDVIKCGYESKLKSLEQEIMNLKVMNDSYQDQTFSSDVETHQEGETQQPPTVSIPPTAPLLIDTTSGGFGLDQVRMMPRGECEGSENNMTPNALIQTPSAINCDMTFEQLLSTDMDNLARDKCIEPYTSHSSSTISQPNSLKEELTRCRTQIKHLQTILRESESNCERVTQLCEALKQEIRRVERDSERKEHLKENTEYLKNIILKFVTLHGEDERMRLIPVIRTMLRLSPSEAEELETAVKGGSAAGGHAQPTREEVTGWSSYVPLPKWSFGGGGK